MGLAERSQKNPAGGAVAVTPPLGLFNLSRPPVQLFPDIEGPRLSVITSWRVLDPAIPDR